MNYPWLDEYCMAKKSAAKDFKAEWDAARYMVGGKMFAMAGSHSNGRPIISVKLLPEEGDFLRRQYEDVIAGYYMNKVHWNSVYLDGTVPDDVLKDMIDKSYAILFASLTQKAQKEIMG